MVAEASGRKEMIQYRNNLSVILHDKLEEEANSLHWHTPFEIIMPVKNSVTVHCNDLNYVLHEGDIMIINSGVLHKLSSTNRSGYLRILADLLSFGSMHEFEAVFSVLSPVVHVTPSNSPQIYEKLNKLLYEIVDEYREEAIFCEASIYSKLITILVMICRNHTEDKYERIHDSSPQPKYSKILLSICNYLDNHYNETITLDQMADLAGFSKYHFSRLFRQYADTSFYQYLNKKRIMQATKLLLETDSSIMEVSLQCGFPSISSFIRMFKIHEGLTPSEFKEMHLPRKQMIQGMSSI